MNKKGQLQGIVIWFMKIAPILMLIAVILLIIMVIRGM